MTEKERQTLRSGHVKLYQIIVDLQRDSFHCVDADSEYVKVLNDMRRVVGGLDILLDASTRKGGAT